MGEGGPVSLLDLVWHGKDGVGWGSWSVLPRNINGRLV